MRIYCNFVGNNKVGIIQFRNGTISHVHTTLLGNLQGATGPTGPAASDSDPWTTYTPDWTAATTNPVLGNGNITGRYKQIGKTVFVSVKVNMGSETEYGEGQWRVSLPVAAQSGYSAILPTTLLDNGTNWYQGISYTEYGGSTSYVTLTYTGSVVLSVVNSAAPFTWTTGDAFSFSGSYESV